MSAITEYGPVLSPDDPEISSSVVGWWSASNAACYPGGVFPAEDANVTAWTDLTAGKVIAKIGSNHGRYKSNLNGIKAVNFWNSFSGTCPGFFGDGTGWEAYGIFALANFAADVNYSNIIRTYSATSTNTKILISAVRSGGIAEISINGKSVGSPWTSFGVIRGMGTDITSPAAGRANRILTDGNLVVANGGSIQLPTPAGSDVTTDLQVANGFSGTWAISELVVVKKPLTWSEGLRLGYWLMQRGGIPRRPNTWVQAGNSMTERIGFAKFFSTELDAEADGAAEMWNLAVSGGTRATLEEQKPDFEEVAGLLEDQDRKAVWSLWHGHNDGGYTTSAPPTDPLGGPNGVPSQYRHLFEPRRAEGHRYVAIGVTPVGSWEENGALLASDALVASLIGDGYADAVLRPAQEVWGDDHTDGGSPGLNPYGYYADPTHYNDAGYANLATWGKPTVLDQLRISWARRATCSGGTGTISVFRYAGTAGDPALADMTIRCVAAGSAAPTTAATPNLTISAAVSSGSFSIGGGSWDVYASQAGSTPAKIGTVSVTSTGRPRPVAAGGGFGGAFNGGFGA